MIKLTPGIPPKDGNVYLVDLGFPYLAMAVWHPIHQEWAWANHQVDIYEGVYQDSYFDTEHAKDDEINGYAKMEWMIE